MSHWYILGLDPLRKIFVFMVLAMIGWLVLLTPQTTMQWKTIRRGVTPPTQIPTLPPTYEDCIGTQGPNSTKLIREDYALDDIDRFQDPKAAKSWKELRSIVSKVLTLENTVAICRSSSALGLLMEKGFPQNFWPPNVAPVGCYGRLHNSLFDSLKPQKSCALVGNGGILRNSHCGAEINSHDFVMRVNLPVISGFEKDVGRKTDLTAVNSIIFIDLKKYLRKVGNSPLGNQTVKVPGLVRRLAELNDSILWLAYNMSYKGVHLESERGIFRQVIRKTKLEQEGMAYRVAYSPVPLWPQLISRVWNKTGNSEGFVLFTLATLLCEELTLYGFWPFPRDARGRHLTHHYYDSQPYDTYRKNVMPVEFEILKEFGRSNVIRLVLGRCRNEQ